MRKLNRKALALTNSIHQSKCAEFADPYVEYDTLTLLLDLILLKRGVFRHILFNRGYEPRRVVEVSTTEKLDDDDKTRLGKLQQKRENVGMNIV